MAKERKENLNVVFCSSEVAPFSKTGGLADVAGALPAALDALGHDVHVVTPLYRCVDRDGLECTFEDVDVPLAGRGQRVSVWRGRLPNCDVPVHFVDCPSSFDREELYQREGRDYEDNIDRFALFSRAVLRICRLLEIAPDVAHCNDWQTALVPVYLKTELARDPLFASTRALFTIHNLAYQGLFARADLPRAGLSWELFSTAGLEYWGGINLMKGGIVFADGVNTVSPTYSREIRTAELGAGLDGVLRARAVEPVGILNGVDYAQWSPDADPHLAARYDAEDLSGKAVCKRDLQQACGLPVADVPLVGMVSRLDGHKGLDLVVEAIPELLQLDVQMVILGRGQPALEERLKRLGRTFASKLSVNLALDVPLSHRIIAGSDLFLVPSQFEPCGLTQMYSLRYGTVPVVRRTGGLADTVTDYLPSTLAAGTATGFHFMNFGQAALVKALMLALTVYETEPRWRQLVAAGMRVDYSWGRSAAAYSKLYRSLSEG